MNTIPFNTPQELVNRSDYYHVFVENHLRYHPEERLPIFGLKEQIDPISAMKLYIDAQSLKKKILKNKKTIVNSFMSDLIVIANAIDNGTIE
jgi:hypothetical protein